MVRIEELEVVPIACCNLRHSSSPTHLWDKDDFGYYRCPVCGLVWVSPQLTDESVAHIYLHGFDAKLLAHPRPTSFTAYSARLRRMAPYNKWGRLLDVGCFTGNFLLAAQEAGWREVEGTEISSSAVRHAREVYGLTVHHGDLLDLDLPHTAYDAVTLSDVIEHVRDPMATLHRVSELLRPEGVLYIDTPHFSSVTRLILGKRWSVFFPWHRTYFSANNMQLALETAGFRIKHISAVGVMPFSRFNAWRAYISPSITRPLSSAVSQMALIQRYKDSLRPLWLTFKRATEVPFVLLSRLGIHVGSRLVVYAEKA